MCSAGEVCCSVTQCAYDRSIDFPGTAQYEAESHIVRTYSKLLTHGVFTLFILLTTLITAVRRFAIVRAGGHLVLV